VDEDYNDEDLEYLIRAGFIEKRLAPDGRWLYRLTSAGWQRAMYERAKEARN